MGHGMKIGILSDTHDNTVAVDSAMRELAARGVELIIHCGDIQSPETIDLFRPLTTHFVLGNCDGPADTFRPHLTAIGAQIHEPFGELELGGKRIGWLHSHDLRLFMDLEFSDHFDYLFYGHTHRAEQHRRGRTLVVNPGALFRVRQRSFVVLDVATGELESVVV
jgi:uncharacterized protein